MRATNTYGKYFPGKKYYTGWHLKNGPPDALYTVSWGQIIPRQKYQKIAPVTISNLVTVLGVGRSGKAKKVDVPQRPSEIMANNHIGGKQLKCT